MCIDFIVNGKHLECGNIWYHYHSNPKRKGPVSVYKVNVPLENEKIIKRIELMTESKISNSNDFLEQALKHDKSSFNLIQYIQDEIECQNSEITWVFYNIKSVSVENGCLIIMGDAGEAY